MSLPKGVHLERFASVDAFVSHVDGLSGRQRGRASAFTGHETFEQSVKLARDGWPHIVDDANKIIADIEASGLIARGQPTYVNDVAGAFPNVPAYLAGSPECMFRRGSSELLGEQSPLTVYLDVSVWAGTDADQIKKRGIAILALVMILSERRPVDLYVFSSLGAGMFGGGNQALFCVMPVETRPLDISTATYALTSAGFLRNLCFAWADKHGFDGGYAWHKEPRDDATRELVREVLGASPQDLVIYGAGTNEKHLTDPIGWLHDQLKAHMPQSE
jgi:hypothetical protein